MSLQVWLPLNGNFNNQGIGKVTIDAGTPIFKTAGKIGEQGIDLKTQVRFSCPALANLSTFTVAFWAKAESSSTLTGTWVDLFGFSSKNTSGSTGNFRWETCYSGSSLGIHWHNNTVNALTSGSANHISKKDTWVHCCVVFNKEKGKLYSYNNGSLFYSATHLGGTINGSGQFYFGQTNKIEGIINDLRIYDHALSSKEVEEIAKGLVLHYKLDTTINNGIVYDCSGYGHNGTMIGSLTTNTNTGRYRYATQFNGSSYIAIGTQLYNMRDEMSINLWVNKTWSSNVGTPFSSVQSGGFGWQVNSTNYTFYCGTGASSNTYISKTLTTNNLSTGWHMLSATYDGLALKLYIDGVLKSTTSKYSTKTPLYYNNASGMFVGGESAGNINTTSTDRFKGSLSDLRIYATALTEEQIRELYNTSVTIDNLGNIYAREFDENSNLNITKTGLFQSAGIKDGNYSKASILKNTKTIQGNNLYEY